MNDARAVNARPLLIADGLIPTTEIAARVLSDAFGSVEVRPAEQLVGAPPSRRPLFVSRLVHPRYGWLADHLRGLANRYVYLLDDNFFELTVDYDKHNGSFFSHPEVHATLDRFLANAAQVWLMSKPLETYLLRRNPALSTRYIPAPIDIALFDRFEPTFSERGSGAFVVGYPSTHRPNVAALLTEVVTQCLEQFGRNVKFEFVGWCPDAITGMANVEVFPQVSGYESYVEFVCSRKWHAALAPLSDSGFENAKTNLKFREYGVARIAGIYSQVPLFSSCVRHEQNGLLANNNATEWVESIARLMVNRDLRNHITSAARADVEEAHDQRRVAETLRQAFAVHWNPPVAA